MVAIACDLPSGVSTDSGQSLSPIGDYDLTVTFGALKPAHRLMPAMAKMGRVVLADIGIHAEAGWFEIGRLSCRRSIRKDTNTAADWFTAWPGRCPARLPFCLGGCESRSRLCSRFDLAADQRAAVIDRPDRWRRSSGRTYRLHPGRPGLGDVPQVLTLALTAPRPIVIDADAIGLVGNPNRLHGHDTIVTPHEGEFRKLFGQMDGSKPERALEAAVDPDQ